jgi:DNA-directed RNA polymerase beta' subunit
MRAITSDEIENILDFITPQDGIPPETAKSIVEINKNKIRYQLKNQQIYPQLIPILKKEIKKAYYSSLLQAGENIGIIAAQSIGEDRTQATLNTFHSAGITNTIVTESVPRFQELINASKMPKNPSCKLYFKDKKTINELRDYIGKNVIEIKLEKIIQNFSFHETKKEEKWYEIFKKLYNNNFENYEIHISYTLNIDLLYQYKLTLEEIALAIEENYNDVYCVFSPPQLGQIDIYFDIANITLDERKKYINDNNKIYIFLEECAHPILKNILLSGVENIQDVFYNKVDNEWVAETQGSNLNKLLRLDYIDKTRIISNNIWEIYRIFGIESALEYITQEFDNIMNGVNYCHIRLLAERMTTMGIIQSMTRYTMRSVDSGPLSKCTFEEPLDIILSASYNCETDKLNEISSSVLAGKKGKYGTGMFDMKMDLNKIINN